MTPTPSYTLRRSLGHESKNIRRHATGPANEYTMGSVRVEEKAIPHVARDCVIDIARKRAGFNGECHMGSATRRQER